MLLSLSSSSILTIDRKYYEDVSRTIDKAHDYSITIPQHRQTLIKINEDEILRLNNKGQSRLLCSADNACFQNLVRGTSPNSLGHYLSNEGYRVVPSPVFPSPGASGYYSGGYDVRTHGSRYSGVVDAVQVEIPREERFSSVRRPKIARALARAVKYFMDDHY